MTYDDLTIRPAAADDADAIWAILEPVIRAGETYTLPCDLSRVDALAYWIAPEKETFVAEANGRIVGTYYLRANQAGGGDHVCNCGYMTAGGETGRGVARAMCRHSMHHAQARGFRAMQFNFVVSTNVRAVKLWQDLGFEIAGTLPRAFRHPTYGEVDAHVMFQPFPAAPDAADLRTK